MRSKHWQRASCSWPTCRRKGSSDYVDQERERASAELISFLQPLLGSVAWSSRVEEGAPLRIISDAATETDADLVVIGTHGRSGIAKVLLGSVAEEVLRTLEVDILAVPPVAAQR